MKAIGIANAVKEGVNQNKENQQILAQATVEANNDKIEQLEKQQTQLLHAVLMTQQPPTITCIQDTTVATIKAPTDKIN